MVWNNIWIITNAIDKMDQIYQLDLNYQDNRAGTVHKS